ncbi:non-ribosomal peptide synthetase [Azospirillum sp. B510]|uniref:non-ribosomal peptide synthetase n=1 Tax=Azospirillum sp. (strain B510) TaxID=137722 RepID=UPI0013050C0C|nr:non-ribosomal peptide synthetase [Azospirillum sp. B510]
MAGLIGLRTEINAQDTAFTFLSDHGETAVTWAELAARAGRIAAQLRANGLNGRRALLLASPGAGFVAGLYGCLLAGTVAVPCHSRVGGNHGDRVNQLAEDAALGGVLAETAVIGHLDQHDERLPALRGLPRLPLDSDDFVEDSGAGAGHWEPPPIIDPAAPAIIQFTSGSTGRPRGVVLTHRNLLDNLAHSSRLFGLSGRSVGVSWLPPYHDMGLIGGILSPLYAGFPAFILPPTHFLGRPLDWLRVIARTGATISGAPNFAYDLCVEKATDEDIEALDLSHWEVAFCGAEPIFPDTLDRFARRFARAGFDPSAFRACYGLAEATLFVSGSPGRPKARSFATDALQRFRVEPVASDGQTLVGHGHPPPGIDIAIVDPVERRRCEADEVGEIWVRGASVSNGYWQREMETGDVFQGVLQEAGEGGFLRTGDLGFVFDGDLFITGRSKDLIIVAGANHAPQNLERIAETCHPALRASGCAAFSVPDEAARCERIVIVQEVLRRHRHGDLRAIADAIRQSVLSAQGLQADWVVLIPHGALPRTSSGKVRRRACRDAFLDGTLTRRALAVVSSALEAGGAAAQGADIPADGHERRHLVRIYLEEQIARAMGRDGTIDGSVPLAFLGIDSLSGAVLLGGLEARFGVRGSLQQLLESSLTDLVDRIAADAPNGERGRSAEAVPGAGSRDDGLSFVQKGLWYLHAGHPESSESILALAWRLPARTETADVEKACRDLLERHPLLRAVFPAMDDGGQRRIVRDEPVFAFRRHDGTGSGNALAVALNREAWRPFDLTHGPLIRFDLFAGDGDRMVLLVSVHHIICDYWSLSLLFEELATAIAAPGAVIPAPDRSFADYVVQQRAMLAGPDGERLRAYWTGVLRDLPPLARLEAGSRRMTQAGGSSLEFSIPAAVLTVLKALADSRRVSLFTVLLAAFNVVAQRFLAEDDFVVGSAVAARPSPDWGRTVGPLVNLLPLAARIRGDAPFPAVLERTWDVVLGALDHKDYPFALMVEQHRGARPESGNPFFAIVFNLLSASVPFSRGFDALSAEPIPLTKPDSQFDLMLSVTEREDGLACLIEYDRSAVGDETVSAMAAHYRLLAEEIARDPERRVSEFPVPEDGLGQAAGRNGGVLRGGDGVCWVRDLFEAAVRRTPDAIAVRSGGEALTYAQLDARANRLADHLRARGAFPDRFVGVALERSCAIAVALLAVNKAGAAYVPLDPTHPPERNARILAECGAGILITQDRLAPTFRGTAPELVVIDRGPPGVENRPDSDPELCVRPDHRVPDHIAYVLFTSGSTGQPKGVMVTQRGLTNMLQSMVGKTGITAEDRLAAVTTFSFDMAQVELFLPLIVGGSVDILPACETNHGEALRDALTRATVMQATPATWQMLTEAGWREGRHLTVITGGEALNEQLAQRMLETGARVLNYYGPTETAVYSTGQLIDRADDIAIGGPIADTQVYVLDAWMRPRPAGLSGELYIGGAGLARGYLGRPDLTAERFIPDPFGPAGGRLYRTGDRVRFRPDGNLDYLGRLDRQVKIRGHRIEPGEVEAVLRRHPVVEDALVVPRASVSGDTVLTAYVILRSAFRPSSDADARHRIEVLKEHLAAALPRIMVPRDLVFLDAMPRLSNGKIDRKALPVPDPLLAGTSDAAPATPTEYAVARIWADLLGAGAIGRDDDFFALGGHSLLGMRLSAAIHKAFGVELRQTVLFHKSTLRQLSADIDRLLERRVEPDAPPPANAAVFQEPLPLTAPQQRVWYLESLMPGTPALNSVFCARIWGTLDVGRLRAALGALVRRHPILRSTFRVIDGEPRREVHERLAPDAQVVEWPNDADSRDAQAFAHFDDAIHRPFDLGTGPLLRLFVYPGPSDLILGLVTHHLIADGLSLDIAMGELSVLYNGLAAADAWAEAVPSPATDGGSEAVHVARHKDARLEDGLRYWREALTGLSPLNLPPDFPRPPVLSWNGDWRELRLGQARSERLRRFAAIERKTPFMVLLAALNIELARLCDQPDIIVGTAVANREGPEVFEAIGNFVNMLALRTHVDGGATFRDVLERTRATCLEAFRHQHVPFEQVVAEVKADRHLAHSVLLPVLFVLQPPRSRQDFAGMPVEVVERGLRAARADLEIHFWDEPEFIGRVVYSTDLFAPETVERFIDRFLALLDHMMDDPERSLAAGLPLAADDRRLIGRFRCAEAALPTPFEPVHAMIQRQAERQPDAVAVRCGGRMLTYRQLDKDAGRLSRRLRRLGVGPEVRAGVLLPRSVDAVIAILAVLKAGGAYVPLDPLHPPQRLNAILRSSDAAAVITTGELADVLAETGPAAILIDGGQDGEEDGEAQRPATVDSGHLAYVIHTSGSTGVPKGVQITHGALANLVMSMRHLIGIGAGDVQTSQASFAFDASVAEIFPPLAAGATLALLPESALADGHSMRTAILDAGATVVQATATQWRMLLEAGGFGNRQIKALFGAEPADPQLVAAITATHDRVWHMYGPTETTVWSAAQVVSAGMSLSLGEPLAGTDLHILDDHGNPVPIGVEGELCIGGIGLARGYLNAPAETALRFMPDPFCGRPGARLYRTGDRARMLASGDVVLCGRTDHQIKLRGFRIEAGEVEAALLRHTEIAVAAVTVNHRPGQADRLVAHVQTAAGCGLPPPEVLRHSLGRVLPHYMIPSLFIPVERMPRTATGKLDRKALPAVEDTRPSLGEEFTAPRTEEERKIAEIWRNVLSIDRVGIYDNFFALGGDSMRALRVIYESRAIGLDITLQYLLSNPTVFALAQNLPEAPALEGMPEGGEETVPFALLSVEDRARLRTLQSRAGER